MWVTAPQSSLPTQRRGFPGLCHDGRPAHWTLPGFPHSEANPPSNFSELASCPLHRFPASLVSSHFPFSLSFPTPVSLVPRSPYRKQSPPSNLFSVTSSCCDRGVAALTSAWTRSPGGAGGGSCGGKAVRGGGGAAGRRPGPRLRRHDGLVAAAGGDSAVRRVPPGVPGLSLSPLHGRHAALLAPQLWCGALSCAPGSPITVRSPILRSWLPNYGTSPHLLSGPATVVGRHVDMLLCGHLADRQDPVHVSACMCVRCGHAGAQAMHAFRCLWLWRAAD